MVDVSPERGDESLPTIPEGLLEALVKELEGEDAPFVEHLGRDLELDWLEEEEHSLNCQPEYEGSYQEFLRQI